MWSPTCDGHAGKVSDGVYTCGDLTNDNGGVHSNSGIPNHAYALLVDGGTFNGQTINAIGMVKAAHIFWRAQSVYLTNTSDFDVNADALEMACTDLLGINLQGLSTTTTPAGLSGEMITAADCAEVAKAILAVEMRTDPTACGYSPLFAAAPALCIGASSANAIFYEDFEAGLGAFTATSIPTNPASWTARDWLVTASAPDGRAGTVAYAVDPDSGDCTGVKENGVLRLESPVIAIPAGTDGPLQLAFDHYVSIEEDWDGANIKYSRNGGAWTLLPSASFTANAYNRTLKSAATDGSDNPLEGQTAFSGADGGSLRCTWGQSQADLSTIGLVAGDNIQFRWELGTDCGFGWDGWYLDDIRLFTCALPAVSFATDVSQGNEGLADTDNGCLDYYETTLTVNISTAPSAPVDVTFSTAGTATNSTSGDYSFTPASVTLDGANLSQTVTVRIYDDGTLEGDETAILSYSLNANGGDGLADAFNQTHTLTIVDNDFAPGAPFATAFFTEDFDGGIPDTWTNIDATATNAGVWTSASTQPALWNSVSVGSTGAPAFSSAANGWAVFDSDALGDDSKVEQAELTTTAINCTGYTGVILKFEQVYCDFNSSIFVDISNDGTNFTPFEISPGFANNGCTGNPDLVSLDISAIADNQATVYVRWRFEGDWSYWWLIDDVALEGMPAIATQTAVNMATPPSQHLGPNARVHFYDPMSNNIVASIQNLSAHDYGCTSIEVLSSGTTSSLAWNSGVENHIASKTYKVTPTTNNSTGSYQITLYYTEAEIAGWEAETGRLRSEFHLIKTTNDFASPDPADDRESSVATGGTLNTDLSYSATFATGFSEFGIGAGSDPLPVELVDFSGRHSADGNLLSWQTASEINSDYFDLERSSNGIDFILIERKKGAGESNTPTEYEYLDRNYLLLGSYYRLKQVDLNEDFVYSNVIFIKTTTKSSYFSLSPNPTLGSTQLNIGSYVKETVSLIIYDAQGKKMISRNLDLLVGDNQMTIDLQDFASGLYFLQLRGQENSKAIKLIKQ